MEGSFWEHRGTLPAESQGMRRPGASLGSSPWTSWATLRRLVFSNEGGIDHVPARLLLLRIRNNSWNPLNPRLGMASAASATLPESG